MPWLLREAIWGLQACGSGGTTAGVALGNHLSGYGARIWAYGVCDDPEYFYGYINEIFRDLGAPDGQSPHSHLHLCDSILALLPMH